jgi:opacity protein-like surface antigen
MFFRWSLMMIRIVLIALVLGLTDLAMAADEPVDEDGGTEVSTGEAEPFEPSKYGSLGLAIGVDQFSRFDPVDLNGSNRIKVDANEGIGLDLVFGYRWHRNASVEAHFVYMQGLDDNRKKAEVEYEAFTANLKVYPVTGRVEPYAFAGIGAGRFQVEAGRAKNSEWGNVFRLGAGVDLNYTETLAVSVGGAYLFARGDVDGRDMLEFKLGLTSRFW